jgi:hypothetical protein
MGQGHPRGKHQGGLITVTLIGAARVQLSRSMQLLADEVIE